MAPSSIESNSSKQATAHEGPHQEGNHVIQIKQTATNRCGGHRRAGRGCNSQQQCVTELACELRTAAAWHIGDLKKENTASAAVAP